MLSRLRTFWNFLFRRWRVEAEMEEEFRSHLRIRSQDLERQGHSREDAERQARIEFGGYQRYKDECREALGTRLLGELTADVRYGLRQFRRNPGFTGVAILALALGIGATAAIFSVVYGVLLRPLPYPDPQQLVSISEVASDGHLMGFTDANFRDLRSMNRTLQRMAVYWAGPATVSSGSNAARLDIAGVSSDFFRVLDVAPILGRDFSADELREGGSPAALVSYGYWRERMGSSRDLSAFKLTSEAHAFSVVGVLPPEFDFPAHTDLWVPDQIFGKQSPSRTAHNWGAAIARLGDGDSMAEARANLSILARRLYQQYKPEIDMRNVSVTPLRSALTAKVRPALLILLATVGFLLFVACANVANLLLARGATRKRELAVRAALGAGRGRLVRQFLTESLLLSLTGGGLGVLLALWGVEALLALAPPGLPRIGGVTVNLPVLGFALGISLLVAVSLGTLTALRVTATGPQATLAQGSRWAAGSLASRKLARVLIGGQVAVALILLAGAGLLGRSLLQVLAVNPGFRTSKIVSMEIEVPHPLVATNWSDFAALASDTRPARFMETLFSRLRGLPGMDQVGGVDSLPLSEGGPCSDGKFLLLDQEPQINPANPADEAKLGRLWSTSPGGDADYCVASGGYFRALGIPLIHGRLFNDGDTANSQPVAIVSQSVARASWPDQDPLGHTIEYGNMDGDLRLLTVVGVVGDVHERSLEKPADHTVYVDYRQRLRGGRDFTVVMRSATRPSVLIADARRIVHEVAPGATPRFETFRDVFSASLDTRRFNLTLVGVFAASALLLAAIGIFGVMAYWVSQRTNELGVRIALGARKRDVLGMIIGEGTKLALNGVAIGVAGALALTRFLSSLLFGVKPTDPLTFIAVVLILVCVALLACYVPARRAMKVDPMVALRHE